MYVNIYAKILYALAIMNDNDMTQTKYIAHDIDTRLDEAPSIGDKIHIVIDNVTQNTGTSLNDAMMSETTTIKFNDKSVSNVKGTWTSTILPNELRVELIGEVINISGDIVTTKCLTNTNWPDSVFNRLPWMIEYYYDILYKQETKRIHITNSEDMLSIFDFPVFCDIVHFKPDDDWSNNNRLSISANNDYGYDTLIFGDSDLFRINDRLPSTFINHWANTIHAELLMIGISDRYYYGLFVPPESP